MSRNQMPLPEPRTQAQKRLQYHMAYGGYASRLQQWWVFYGSRQVEQVVCGTLGSAIGCSIAIGLWSLVL